MAKCFSITNYQYDIPNLNQKLIAYQQPNIHKSINAQFKILTNSLLLHNNPISS